MRTALADDRQELVDRLLQLRVAVSDVARVVAVVLADDLVQPHELVGGRHAPGIELKPGREAERACVHGLADEGLHRAQLRLGRLRAEDAGRVANGVVADEPGEVLRVAVAREPREMVGEARPLDRPVVRERAHAAFDEVPRRIGDRRVRPAAVADDLGRHSLANRALGLRVREDRPVTVAVRIDEAGADDAAGRLDDAVGAAAVHGADVRDPAVLDRDVAAERRAAASVHDPAVANQEVRRHYFLVATSPMPPPTRGSSTSRRPSPRKLKPRTTIMIASPGKIDIQMLWSM